MNKKPVLTVMLVGTDTDVLARGISEDEDVFKHLHFKSVNEAGRYLFTRYAPVYRVILNLDPSVRRFA